MTTTHAVDSGRTPVASERRPRRDVDGILVLDKPPGLSSNQALQVVRRLFDARKAGHTGSLDPLATGMLPVCLGQATKVSGFLIECDKSYRVRVSFGSATETGDAEGAVIATGPSEIGEAPLRSALMGVCGTLQQVPPMYSALKHQGRRLYQLARAGVTVARPPRPVMIHEIDLEEYHPQHPVIRVRCGKGTYIRTLVEQIAERVGTVAHVAMLRRLTVGAFAAAEMVTVAGLEQTLASGGHRALDGMLLPLDRAVSSWPAVTISAEMVYRLRCGQRVDAAPDRSDTVAGLVRVYGEGAQFVGIGECLPGGGLVPWRLMAQRAAGSPGQFGL